MRRFFFIYGLLMVVSPLSRAEESFEFIGEHLPETAADNRYGSLPLAGSHNGKRRFVVQSGYSQIRSQDLQLAGRQLAIGYSFSRHRSPSLKLIGFSDTLFFSGGNRAMPLDVKISDDIPLSLPVGAEFGRLGGRMEHNGLGLFTERNVALPYLGEVHRSWGAIIEEYHLIDYRMSYRITSGPSTGATGVADYSANYRFFTPMLQLMRDFDAGRWRIAPRVTFALPLPRQGVQGRLTGPGFDISGDTADNGKGRHYGDFSLTFGLDLGYRPWNLSIDLGMLVSQALFEPLVHQGIERNIILSIRWEG